MLAQDWVWVGSPHLNPFNILGLVPKPSLDLLGLKSWEQDPMDLTGLHVLIES